jgi:CheY-like chemotaxis protein
MTKVLIVDDEAGYRDHLAFSLSGEGHEVETAASGSRAIEMGSRCRPHVLVADWMLKESIHGLHVSEVLRTLVPELQTILITGYGSRDLRAKAEQLPVFDFIEKPFALERLHAAVNEAVRCETPPAKTQIAVLEVNADGSIEFANNHAKELFAQTCAGADTEQFARFFKDGEAPDLNNSLNRWQMVDPIAEEPLVWYVHSRMLPNGGEHLAVLHLEGEEHLRRHPVVKMLLDIPEVAYRRWPLEGRVLIVDDEELTRHVAVTMLEAAGGICHAAESRTEALRLFKLDSDIQVVLADYEMPDGRLADMIRRMRTSRPETIVIGISGLDRREEFAELGVTQFLPKPWRIDDLINLLTNRIGNCVECGLPIPLRRPQPGEEPLSWACCGCGCRYAALLDDSFSADIKRNVQRVE